MSRETEEAIDRGRRAFLSGRFAGDGRAPNAAQRVVALLDREACVAWNGVICLGCRTACGERAIELDPRGRPAIIAGACTGCGECVDPCPPRAIRVPGAGRAAGQPPSAPSTSRNISLQRRSNAGRKAAISER